MPKGAHKYRTMHVEPDTKPQQRKCVICNKKHSEAKRPTLLAASIDQRWDLVKSKKFCFGCLRGSHQRRQCSRSMKCGVDSCEKGHHCLLHSKPRELPVTPPRESQKPLTVELPQGSEGANCGKAQASMPGANKVALKAIAVSFVSDSGQVVMGLVLLDSGSETTLIRTGFANQLGISGPRTTLTVDTVGGGGSAQRQNHNASIYPLRHLWQRKLCVRGLLRVFAHHFSGLIGRKLSNFHEHLRDVPIETLGVGGTVDVLLGLDAAALMVPMEVRRGGAMEPYAEKTPLGWVIAGPVQTPGHGGTKKLVCRAHVSEAEDDTNHQLHMFWDVDTFGV